MKTYARIDASTIAELIETDGDIAEMYHSELVWIAIDGVKPTPQIGWVASWSGDNCSFSAPVTPRPTDKDLQGLIASTRYDHETVGVVVDGVAIDTDRDSQALITGATVQAILDSKYICTWKTANGPVQLNATQLIAIATAVRAHVQACFDREAELLAAMADKTFTDAMLTEGWPT